MRKGGKEGYPKKFLKEKGIFDFYFRMWKGKGVSENLKKVKENKREFFLKVKARV
jgi:hypothetical protein